MRSVVPLVAWLGLLVAVGCTPGEVPPLDPPPLTTTTSTEPEPPSPPPPSRSCALPDIGRGSTECYITVARAGTRGATWMTSTGLIHEMWRDDEIVHLARNFARAAELCGDALKPDEGPFFVSGADLQQIAAMAFVLHDGGRGIDGQETVAHPSFISYIGEGEGRGRLELVNRRCPEQFGFCGRTEVFKPGFEEFRQILREHKAHMEAIDARAVPLGLDGIRHWAESTCR